MEEIDEFDVDLLEPGNNAPGLAARCAPWDQLPYAADCARVALEPGWLSYAVSAAIARRPVRTHAINHPALSGASRGLPVKGGGVLAGGMIFAGAVAREDGCDLAPLDVPPPAALDDFEVDVVEDDPDRPFIPLPLGLLPAGT
jgi:hypothetical protein